jgi:glycerol-3-phosphate acyltransferase PlsY
MLSPMSSDTAVDVAITLVVGYLIGSIPIANMVAARRARVDLRTVGDRNPGFWNARETLGKRAAIPVFVGDVAKGVIAALVGAALANPGVWGLAYVGTGAAMVGHAFPVFQLVIEGPYRTAATGVLMTFIGLRFAMAAIGDRRGSTIDQP